MAEGVSGECVCGFSVVGLMSGALRSGGSRQLMVCYTCGVLESRSHTFGEGDKVCATCQQEMTGINYKHNEKYRCPKCRKPELRLHTTMMID